MTVQQAISYIENYTWSATRLGLERTQELLSRLGNPQKSLKFIHVAGSNGKGSTCAMLASVLQRAGYQTGLYTSPHIQRFHERFQINGENITGANLAAVTEKVKEAADAMADHPSQFELSTALALVYFQMSECDIVVLEVGMGGALDSTNAIDSPEAAVITNIGLEHTEYLGRTIEEIARAKGGIIKPECDCICYDGNPAATAVVEDICREKSVRLRRVDFSQLMLIDKSLDGQRLLWNGMEFDLPLLGEHQLHNAATVLETILALRGRGWDIPDEAIRAGLAAVRWPARFEVLNRDPLFILDGAHNPQCAQALADCLRDCLPNRKVTFLMGVLADKDYGAMLNALTPYSGGFVCLTPDSPRALPGEVLAEELRERGFEAETFEDVGRAIAAALSLGRPIVAFGSLYMAGDVRTAFFPTYRKWLRKRGIRARDGLSTEERERLSRQIVNRTLASPVFRDAKTILLYRATRGEVSLAGLEVAPEAQGKRLLYPLCTSDSEMISLLPKDEDAWEVGRYGISEPVLAHSVVVAPEEIDLILCPCTVFDEGCNRMGMGAGFYDRYLTRCPKAIALAVAFECQKVSKVPIMPWDKPMGGVITERRTYDGKK